MLRPTSTSLSQRTCPLARVARRRPRAPLPAPPRAASEGQRPPSPHPTKPAGLGASARAQVKKAASEAAAAAAAAPAEEAAAAAASNALPLPRGGRAVRLTATPSPPPRRPTIEPGSRAAAAVDAVAAQVEASKGARLPPPAPPAAPPPAPPPRGARAAARVRGAVAAAPSFVRWLASIVRLCWLALPFRVRASFWPLAGAPAPPSLHASPRAAALRAAASRGDGAAALPALGYGPDGRHPEPLADVPRWRLEALVGRGLSARAADRVRAALTLPAALSLSVPASARSEFERLEYLGDAVLELAARRFAMRAFSRATEHVLCNAARSLVCGRTLLAAASVARLDAHAAANGHAMADGAYLASWAGPGGAALMVDTFESIAGALFCEYGLESAADWVMTKLTPVVGAPLASVDAASPPPPSPNAPPPPTPSPSSLLGLDHNYKSLLVLAAGADGVSYRGRHVCAREWGGVSSGHPVAAGAASLPAVGGGGRPRDAWVWRAECRVRGEVKGVGSDLHRATAEQAAARAALAAMGVDAEALWLDRVADQL